MENFYDQPRNKKIKYHVLSSYSEIIETIREISGQNSDGSEEKRIQLWYRGSIDAGFGLIPSLYRDQEVIEKFEENIKNNPDLIKDVQEEHISQFQTRRMHKLLKNMPSGHLLPRPESILNWLSLMEHYQMTTCYLNWSLKPEVSLFFALEYMFNTQMRNPKKKFSCLWILKPIEMNELLWLNGGNKKNSPDVLIDEYIQVKNIEKKIPTFYDVEKEIRISKSGGKSRRNQRANKIRSYGDSQEKYNHKECSEIIRRRYQASYPPRPINIFPQVNSDRILSQKGIFTIFPVEYKESRKKYFKPLDCYSDADLFLECIILTNPKRIKDDLDLLGFDPYDVYPEITYRPGMINRN